jgi:hypothetical protein
MGVHSGSRQKRLSHNFSHFEDLDTFGVLFTFLTYGEPAAQ